MYPDDLTADQIAKDFDRRAAYRVGGEAQQNARRARPTLPEISEQAEHIAGLTASLHASFTRLRDNLVGSEPRLTEGLGKESVPDHVPLDQLHSSQTATVRTLHRLIEMVDQTQAELFGKM